MGITVPPQVSLLVDTFLEEASVQLVEADIVDCWNASAGDVPRQSDTGCFADAISYLDELAMCQPTRHTWNTLVFSMPTVGEDPRCQSLQLDYVPRQPVNLGEILPPLWFCVKTESGEFICKVWGLLLEGMILAYDLVNDESDWIAVEGCMGDLSQAKVTSAKELSELVMWPWERKVHRVP